MCRRFRSGAATPRFCSARRPSRSNSTRRSIRPRSPWARSAAFALAGVQLMKTNLKAFVLFLTVMLSATLAPAQLATKKTLTIDDGKKVAAAAVAEAKKGAGTAAIAVVDDGGNLMLVERLDNTFAAGANIS